MAGDQPNRQQLPPLNIRALAEALLPNASTLVAVWLPGGKETNGEYLVASYWRSEKTPSLSVRVKGEKAGHWSDFGGDHAGRDLVSLYAAIHGMDNGHAAVELARHYGLESVANVQSTPAATAQPRPPVVKLPPAPAAKPKPDPEGWKVLAPVPAYAPAATFEHFSRDYPPEHIATYARDGELWGYVVRWVTSTGRKDPMPRVFCQSPRDGGSKWNWKTWEEPRPLYLPGGTSPGKRTVILVEGEMKAEALQNLLSAGAPGVYVVVSWVGGCKAWKKADWSWLAGCTVLMWPDCDGKREKLTKAEEAACLDAVALEAEREAKPLLPVDKQGGMAAMLGIGALLRDAHTCAVQLLPIPAPGAVKDGWDCRDAIELDGWDFDRVLAFFGQAYALPPGGGSAVPVVEKKRERLVATVGGGDIADDEGEWIGGKSVPMWLLPFYSMRRQRWETSRELVIAALRNDPALCEVLAYNELTHNIEARTLWPWPHAQVGDITEEVDLMLGEYLTSRYGLPSMNRAFLKEAITTVGYSRRFHPIREYLKAVVWDQKSRIDKWLVHALGESPDTLSAPMLEYLQLVGRYWLLGMVNRVMVPGCKFDYCPVLEGVGGLRKSTLVEILAGSKHFSDTPFQVGKGKEAQEQVQGLWVYEIAELMHFSKTEVGAIKAFISSKVDRFRAAYAATVAAHARQCVLVGSTNENSYLRDRTGNRRFWPTPVKHQINTDWVAKYRDQLFAEAFALFGQGVPYTPTADQERRLFAPMQASRLMETPVESALLHLLTRSPTPTGSGSLINELTQYVTLSQLTEALGADAAKAGPGLAREVTAWMTSEGWEKTKKQVNNVRSPVFVRPKNWPAMDDGDEMVAAQPDAGSAPPIDEDADDVPF